MSKDYKWDKNGVSHVLLAATVLNNIDALAEDLVNISAKQIKEYAKANTNPGDSPGPHPHRPGSNHMDTGSLQNSIEVELDTPRGTVKHGYISTDLKYGYYLELGWVTLRRNIVRYPWLSASGILFQTQDALTLVKSLSNHYMNDTGGATGISVKGTGTAFVKRANRLSGTWRFRKETGSRPYNRV